MHFRRPPREPDLLEQVAHGADQPTQLDNHGNIKCGFCEKSGNSAQDCHSMRRWRVKNPRPPRLNDQKSNQSLKKRDRVAGVASSEIDDSWISLLSSDRLPEPCGPFEYTLDTGANVSVVNFMKDLKDLKTIQSTKINGISGGVTAKKSGTHSAFMHPIADSTSSLISVWQRYTAYSMTVRSAISLH